MRKVTIKSIKTMVLAAMVAGTAACMSTTEATINPATVTEPVVETVEQAPILEETVVEEVEIEASEDTAIPAEQVSAEETAEDVSKAEEIEAVAKDVIKGLYGNGSARITALKEAGYDPAEVQAAVDALYGIKSEEKASETKTVEAAKEVTPEQTSSEQTPSVSTETVSKPASAPVQAAPVKETVQPAQQSGSACQGPVIAHSDTERNYCDEYGCYDANGDYRAKSDCQTTESAPAYSEPTYTEPAYTEPVYEAPTYYSGDWHSASYYGGKTLQIGGYSSTIVAYGGQEAVNAPGTSCAEDYEKMCIMDHNVQGFHVIMNNNVAYIGGQKFVKVAQYNNAKNLQTWFDMGDGTSLADVPIDAICMYTCNDWGGVNITMTLWQPA